MRNPPPEKTMSPFSFSMIALGRTTEQDVRDVLKDLDLGVLESIYRRDLDDGRAQFFVHYASTSVIGEALAAQLANVEKRQSEGEVDVWPKRIEYGFNEKTQKPIYWQIYKTATKAERAAASKANTAVSTKMKARLA